MSKLKYIDLFAGVGGLSEGFIREKFELTIDKWINERKRLKYNDIPKRLQTHKNTIAFLDRYKVIDPTGHSHTVVAHISKDGHYYIYPDPKQVRSVPPLMVA